MRFTPAGTAPIARPHGDRGGARRCGRRRARSRCAARSPPPGEQAAGAGPSLATLAPTRYNLGMLARLPELRQAAPRPRCRARVRRSRCPISPASARSGGRQGRPRAASSRASRSKPTPVPAARRARSRARASRRSTSARGYRLTRNLDVTAGVRFAGPRPARPADRRGAGRPGGLRRHPVPLLTLRQSAELPRFGGVFLARDARLA